MNTKRQKRRERKANGAKVEARQKKAQPTPKRDAKRVWDKHVTRLNQGRIAEY